MIQIDMDDLRQYRELSLLVNESQENAVHATNMLNRFHQSMEEKYGHWMGRDGVDMEKGIIEIHPENSPTEIAPES